VETKHKFGDKTFLGFEHITFVPIQTKLIDTSLLTKDEIDWVNKYNNKCYEKLKNLLKDDERALKWLTEETKPITQ
jgi:Xaa-Pro aminopeptidase